MLTVVWSVYPAAPRCPRLTATEAVIFGEDWSPKRRAMHFCSLRREASPISVIGVVSFFLYGRSGRAWSSVACSTMVLLVVCRGCALCVCFLVCCCPPIGGGSAAWLQWVFVFFPFEGFFVLKVRAGLSWFSYFVPVPSACRSCMVSWIMVAAAAFVFAVTLRPGVHGHGPLELSKRP